MNVRNFTMFFIDTLLKKEGGKGTEIIFQILIKTNNCEWFSVFFANFAGDLLNTGIDVRFEKW